MNGSYKATLIFDTFEVISRVCNKIGNNDKPVCIKSYKNLTLNSQNLGILYERFSLLRWGSKFVPIRSPWLRKIYVLFEYSIYHFSCPWLFSLLYYINKRTGEINTFLYWKLKRAPRKNNNGTTLSNTNQFAQLFLFYPHRIFIDFTS